MSSGASSSKGATKRAAASPGKKIDPKLAAILADSDSPPSKRAATAAVHDIASPLGPETAPPGITQPAAQDMTFEQLRVLVTDRLDDMARELQRSENKVLERLHAHEQKVLALEPLMAHINDLDIFAKVKNYVTVDVVEAQAAATSAEMQVTRDRIDAFVVSQNAQLDDHIKGFTILENELGRVNAFIKNASDEATGIQGATAAAMTFQLGEVREQVKALETRGTAAQVQQGAINLIQQHVVHLTHGQTLLKQHMDALTAHQGQYPCHCRHLDELDRRLALLDARPQGVPGAAGGGPNDPTIGEANSGPIPGATTTRGTAPSNFPENFLDPWQQYFNPGFPGNHGEGEAGG